MLKNIPTLDIDDDELPLPQTPLADKLKSEVHGIVAEPRTTRRPFPIALDEQTPDPDVDVPVFHSSDSVEQHEPGQDLDEPSVFNTETTQLDPKLAVLERIIASFPFPTIRPVQHRAIEVIARSQEEGKKFTILEAPTGSGKSGLSLATARAAKEGAYILTSQNSLSQQMMNDFGHLGLVQLRGKRNYSCHQYNTDCGGGSQLNGGSVCDGCPYRVAKNRFTSGSLGITNYTYYLAEKMYFGELKNREVLVLDEAHNIEREILSTVDIKVGSGRAEETGCGKIPFIHPGEAYRAREWLGTVFVPKAEAILATYRRQAVAADMSQTGTLEINNRIESLNSLLSNVNLFITAEPGEWCAWTDKDGNLLIKPLSAANFAEKHLFSTAPNILLMSATVLDFKTFRRTLGIPVSQSNSLAVSSDFPKKNRRIVYWPVGNMGFKDIESTLPKMAERVAKLLTKYADRRGIIHTHSYRINDYLVDYLRTTQHRHRITTHSSVAGSRESAIAQHIESEGPSVLISPSMTEGLDLKDDLSRFQIIVKTPFPFIDPYTRARMDIDPKWYQLQTAITLTQATGRSVRSAEDYAITIILDSAFERFLIQNEDILPGWWKDSMEFR